MSKKTKQYRLLGVEPSSSLRAVLGQMGEDSGINVDLSASLADAQARLAEASYDLVICAAELPDGNHLDVLNSVRHRPAMTSIPVLLLVPGRGDHAVHEALDKGITEVFYKRDLADLERYLESFGNIAPVKKKDVDIRRALVVEDDRTQGGYYKELLTQHDFSVDHVPSGEAALWEAENRRYDFILVDLVLGGGCSGIQFLWRLRNPALASAQAVAIAMSAYADEARRIEALRAGANAFIPKPVDERELAALIAGMAHRPVPSEGGAKKHAKRADLQPCTRCQPCQLTPRESNICALVAAGYSDKRIAEEMGVSYWTVRTHIAHSFKKCDASNRVELVRRLRGN